MIHNSAFLRIHLANEVLFMVQRHSCQPFLLNALMGESRQDIISQV